MPATDPEPLRLSAGRDGLETGRLTLLIAGEPVEVELTVPAGPVGTVDLLPIFHGLSDYFAARATAREKKDGREISCRAGCGACCRQLVPISAGEALALMRLVAALPQEKQAHLRGKFDAAIAALVHAGLLERVDGKSPQSERGTLAADYFRLGVACPFLENESCSIHADRPLACREYLVTSPPQHCTAPSARTIAMAKMDGHVAQALQEADNPAGWLPLVLALNFDAGNASAAPEQSAPAILREVFGRL